MPSEHTSTIYDTSGEQKTAEELPSPEKTEQKSIREKIKDFCTDHLEVITSKVTDYTKRMVEFSKFYEESLPDNIKAATYEIGMDMRIAPLDKYATRILRATCPEGIEFQRNENYKPIDEIIEEAIDKFQKANPDVEIYWPDDGNSVEVSDLLVAGTRTDDKSIIKNTGDMDKVKLALFQAVGDKSVRAGYLLTLAEHYIDSGSMGHTFSGITLETLDPESPVALSDFIVANLEVANGNLRSALYFAAADVKYLTRRHFLLPYDGDDDEQAAIAIKLRDGIKDQVSIYTPYTELSPIEPANHTHKENAPVSRLGKAPEKEIQYDYSLPNQLGLLYHAAHLAALTSDFSPEALNYLTSGEYVTYFNMQGLAKMMGDLHILRNLYGVKKILNKYKVTSQNEKDFYPYDHDMNDAVENDMDEDDPYDWDYQTGLESESDEWDDKNEPEFITFEDFDEDL